MPNILVTSFQAIWNKVTFNKTDNSQESSSVDSNNTSTEISLFTPVEDIASNTSSKEQEVIKQLLESAQEEDEIVNDGYNSQNQDIIKQLLEAAQEEDEIVNNGYNSQNQDIKNQKIEVEPEDEFVMVEKWSEYENNEFFKVDQNGRVVNNSI